MPWPLVTKRQKDKKATRGEKENKIKGNLSKSMIDHSDFRLDLILDLKTHGNLIFDILEPPAVQIYGICWVYLALRHNVYVYLCIYVFDVWEYPF